MIVEKTIQTKVHIEDHNALMSGHIEAVIRDNLERRFKGVCYMSCLILEISEIKQRSFFIFSRQRQDASATCNVMFSVKGLVIKKNEVIPGCVVKKIDKHGNIICKNDHAAVYLRAHKLTRTIKEGQTIVVRAGAVKYKPFKPEISVSAIPFVPGYRKHDGIQTMFKLSPHKSDLVTKLLKELEEEKASHVKIDKAVYKHFEALLYPYKKKRKLKTITFKQVTESKEVIISMPDHAPKETAVTHTAKKYIAESDKLKLANDAIVMCEDYEVVFGQFIQQTIEYYITLRKLCEAYSTKKLVDDNSNLWSIYNSAKKA